MLNPRMDPRGLKNREHGSDFRRSRAARLFEPTRALGLRSQLIRVIEGGGERARLESEKRGRAGLIL